MGQIKYRVKSREQRLNLEACRFACTASNETFAWATEGVDSLEEVATGQYRVTLKDVPTKAVVTASVSLPDAAFADDEYGCHVAQDDIASDGTFDVFFWKATASGQMNLSDAYLNVHIMSTEMDL